MSRRAAVRHTQDCSKSEPRSQQESKTAAKWEWEGNQSEGRVQKDKSKTTASLQPDCKTVASEKSDFNKAITTL